MSDIIRSEGPETSKKKILEDKISYLEMLLQDDEDFFKVLETIVEERLDLYLREIARSREMTEWLDDYYDESASYDVTENSPYENLALLTWITHSREAKKRILDSELEEYFR
jgi:hypothetical protein